MGTVQSAEKESKSVNSFAPIRLHSVRLLTDSVTACEDATSAPPPPPPPPGTSSTAPPPPPPAESSEKDSIAAAAQSASMYENPGTYEMATSEAKRFFHLDTFDGFRCDINKQMSPFMLAMHSFWLGTTMMPDGRTSSYSFVSQVAMDDGGFMMARVDPGQGSVNGRIHRQLGPILGKLQTGLSSDGSNDSLLVEADVGGPSWMGSAKYGSMGNGIILGCNYMQAITPRLHMGGDGMYIGANGSFQWAGAVKYTMPARTGDEDSPITLPSSKQASPTGSPKPEMSGSSTVCAVWSPAQGLSLDYTRVVTPNRVTLASSLQCSPANLAESQLTVAAEFKLERATLNVAVDGSGQISSLLESKLGMDPGAPMLNLSAHMDHRKDEYKFGYGIKFNG